MPGIRLGQWLLGVLLLGRRGLDLYLLMDLALQVVLPLEKRLQDRRQTVLGHTAEGAEKLEWKTYTATAYITVVD